MRVVFVDAQQLPGTRQRHAGKLKLPAANPRHFASAALEVGTCLQRQRSLLAVGDVLNDTHTQRQRVVFTALLLADMMDPADVSLRGDDAVFRVQLRSGLHSATALLFKAVPVAGMQTLQEVRLRAFKTVGAQAEQCIHLVRPP